MGYSSSLRGFDAFVKPKADCRNQSPVGGAITVVAASVTVLLLLSQFFTNVERHDGLTISNSQSYPLAPLSSVVSHAGRFPLDFKITFPYLTCEQIDVSLDGASFRSGTLAKTHGGHTLVSFRGASLAELKLGTGGAPTKGLKGCTASGKLKPFIVAGTFFIGFNRASWSAVTATLSMGMWGSQKGPDIGNKFNVTHYIHKLDLGIPPPKSSGTSPLRNILHAVNNDFHGIGIANTQVQLVPTTTEGTFGQLKYHQASVVDVTIQPQSMTGASTFPGLAVSYDFTPLTVTIKDRDEDRGNIFLILSSLVGILGGVFVTVQLLTGCLVHSAQEIAKKID